MLKFEISGQKLTRVDKFAPATDSKGYLRAAFTFSSDWASATKTAIFRDEVTGASYTAPLNSSGVCTVPAEVLTRSAAVHYQTQGNHFHVSLRGDVGGVLITTNEVRVDLARSGYTEGQTPAATTPDAYSQFVANVKADADRAAGSAEAAAASEQNVANLYANALKKTVTGAVVRLNDVSPVAHELGVQVHGKNLFNYNAWKSVTANNGTVSWGDDGVVKLTATGEDCYTAYANVPEAARIPVEAGDVFTLSWETDAVNGQAQVLVLPEGKAADFKTADASSKKLTYTVPRGYSYIVIRLGVKTAGVTLKYWNIQVEKGDTATEYVAYIDPASVTLTRRGKNICPPVEAGKTATIYGMTFAGTSSGGISVSGTPTGLARYSLYNGEALVKGGYISMSLTGAFQNIIWDFQLRDAAGAIVKQIQSGTVATINLDSYPNAVSWDIGIKRHEDGVAVGGVVYVQVEVGAEATDYEEYKTAAVHSPAADGSVSGVTSLSPTTTLLTDTPGVAVEATYHRDLVKVIAALEAALNT